MIPFLAGCALTFAAMSVWLWRNSRKQLAQWRREFNVAMKIGYELGRVDQHDIGSESAKEARVM